MKSWALVSILGIFFVVKSSVVAAQEKPKLPLGFSATIVCKNMNSTALAALPNGQVLMGEKHGRIWLFKDEATINEKLLSLDNVETRDEQGLQGIAVHPRFEQTGWIYVFYTAKSANHQRCNRISRFTIKENKVVEPEKIIFETDKAEDIHNGGAISFAADGKLMIGSGETKGNRTAQDLNSTQGKVLRINDDGSIPSDNPFFQKTQGKYRAIYSIGFRQPYKSAVQPETGLYYMNVVSNGGRESIFAVKSGDNAGWPESEGYTSDPRFINPVVMYGGIGNCITGGAFCNTLTPHFPKQYVGRYFFMDYTHNWVRTLDPAAPNPSDTLQVFATNLDRPVDLCFATDGTLYMLNRGDDGRGNTASNNGALWHIRYTGDIPVSKIAFLTQPENTYPGKSFTESVSVAVVDEDGEVLHVSPREISISVKGRNARRGDARLSTVETFEGVATFRDLAINEPGSDYSLVATLDGVPSVISETFNIDSEAGQPTIHPQGGRFSGPVTVNIESPTRDCEIRYTLDGTAPDQRSKLYDTAFQLETDKTVRAVAFKSGLKDSLESTERYSIKADRAYGIPYRSETSGLALPANSSGKLPTLLSETGVFRDVSKLQLTTGFVPYEVNSPLWSDGAQKMRWIGLPPGGRIAFSPTGSWKFPQGTVFVKHFFLDKFQTDLGSDKPLETRLMVVDESGKNGYGIAYRWLDDGTNAALVDEGGADKTLQFSRDTQAWHYPSRQECSVCHTSNAGFVLGVNARQLNRTRAYSDGKVVDNQIRTWNYLEMFEDRLDETQIGNLSRLASLNDSESLLENRVRSYLDANCAHCHQPNGVAANFDARFDTPMSQTNIINGTLRNDLQIEGSKVVTPNDLSKSMMYYRMTSEHQTQRMPPLARNVVDSQAVTVVEEWIRRLKLETQANDKTP